jgi:hypothetical protein
MPLGTNGQTVTTGNVFRPNVWANDVVDFLKSNLVLLPRIKHYDQAVASFGSSVEVPFAPTGTANDKAANTQVTLNGNTATKVTININKHKESSWIIEDILGIQSQYELRSEFTKAAAYAIVEAIDSDILTELKAGSTNTAVGTFGTPLVDAVILSAMVTLDTQKAPRTDRTLAVDPFQHGQLLAIDKFVRYDALGTGTAIINGKVGTIYGFDVVMSQNLPYVVGTPDQHNGVAFHQDAVAIAHQLKPRTQAQYKQEYLGWLLTVDTVYGVKTLRGNFSVVIKS